MEANSAKMFATLVIIFLFGVDLAKNDKVQFAKPAGITSVGGRIRNETAVNLEGPDKECSIPLNQTVWYPPTKTCETLLAKGPCLEGEWMVMSTDKKMPKCKAYNCKFPQVELNSTCVQVKDRSKCPPGMHASITETGVAVCDCQSAHVYWKPTAADQERCYPLFRRGPCAENQFLVFSKRTQKVKCSHNRCPDGEVRPRRSPECIALDTPGGPCNDIEPFTVLTVNETTLELHCAHIHTRHVIEAPLLNCSPGSRRDAAGKCRRSII